MICVLASKVRAVAEHWASWVNQQLTRKGWRPADAARAFGVDDSMVSKWRRGLAEPDPKSLRRIAESLDLPILTVLVAAGYLTAEEAGQVPPAEANPSEVPTMELIEEIRARIAGHLDALDPPAPGRNPQPPPRPDEVADVVFYNGALDQTDDGPGAGQARGRP